MNIPAAYAQSAVHGRAETGVLAGIELICLHFRVIPALAPTILLILDLRPSEGGHKMASGRCNKLHLNLETK